jgi:hypothetical protein
MAFSPAEPAGPIPKEKAPENKDKRPKDDLWQSKRTIAAVRKAITKASKSWGPQRLMIGFRLSGRLKN